MVHKCTTVPVYHFYVDNYITIAADLLGSVFFREPAELYPTPQASFFCAIFCEVSTSSPICRAAVPIWNTGSFLGCQICQNAGSRPVF